MLLALCIAVILGCGLLGGSLNYLLDRVDDKARRETAKVGYPEDKNYFRHTHLLRLVEGVVAAFIVPLFLYSIGNPIIPEILAADALSTIATAPNTAKPAVALVGGPGNQDHDETVEDSRKRAASKANTQKNFLLVAGYCLLAAVSARRFMESASARLLRLERKTKEVEHDVARTRSEVGVIEGLVSDKATAPDGDFEAPLPQNVTTAEVTVLSEIVSGNRPARSATGIALSTGIDEGAVAAALQSLHQMGLVARSSLGDGSNWEATALGQRYMRNRSR